ncbi:MAG: hypothetical protein ACREKI_07090 [Gemmatimonadota bacterium]
MRHFPVVLVRPQLAEEDGPRFPPGLAALVVRGPGPKGRPDTAIVLFDAATEDDFARLVEALWLDRRLEPAPSVQRKLYLLGDDLFLQAGAPDNVRKVGERGPIKGAIEGLRGVLRDLLHRLETAPIETVPTPLGERPARHIVAEIPDPGAPSHPNPLESEP